MRIPADAEIQEIPNRPVGAVGGDQSLPYQAPQHLSDLKIQEVRRMQGFVTGINSVLDALSSRCLEKPVNCGRRIQNNHRASRSSRSRLAVLISAETGLRLWRRSRNSARVGLSAISLISASR